MILIRCDDIDEVQPLLTRFGNRLKFKRGVIQYNYFSFFSFSNYGRLIEARNYSLTIHLLSLRKWEGVA